MLVSNEQYGQYGFIPIVPILVGLGSAVAGGILGWKLRKSPEEALVSEMKECIKEVMSQGFSADVAQRICIERFKAVGVGSDWTDKLLTAAIIIGGMTLGIMLAKKAL